LVFELIVVFIGVTAAFALENFRERREEASYRRQMVTALRASLDDWADHGADVDKHTATLLRGFDEARRRGQMIELPVYRESGGERPPTRAWDGIVVTGAARSLDPALFFRLARFYSRADSFGDRYLRYNSFSEMQVLPYRGDTRRFYDGAGRPKPEYAAYVDRLRDLNREMHAQVVEAATPAMQYPANICFGSKADTTRMAGLGGKQSPLVNNFLL
jgi:hypothetical protein